MTIISKNILVLSLFEQFFFLTHLSPQVILQGFILMVYYDFIDDTFQFIIQLETISLQTKI